MKKGLSRLCKKKKIKAVFLS